MHKTMQHIDYEEAACRYRELIEQMDVNIDGRFVCPGCSGHGLIYVDGSGCNDYSCPYCEEMGELHTFMDVLHVMALIEATDRSQAAAESWSEPSLPPGFTLTLSVEVPGRSYVWRAGKTVNVWDDECVANVDAFEIHNPDGSQPTVQQVVTSVIERELGL